MSSSRSEQGSLGCVSGVIVAHPTEDLISDPSTQGPNGLGLGVAGGARMLGWNPDHPLAAAQQVALKGSRQVAAELERERPLGPLAGPAPKLEVTSRRGTGRLLGQLASGLVDPRRGCGCACPDRLP